MNNAYKCNWVLTGNESFTKRGHPVAYYDEFDEVKQSVKQSQGSSDKTVKSKARMND